MRKLIGFVLFTVLFASAPKVMAVSLDFDGAEFLATTAETIKVGWNASMIDDSTACTDCEYEVRVYHVERKTYINAGSTKELNGSFKLPKTGHYWAEVRGCHGTGADRVCSDWATSVKLEDKPQVNGVVKIWRIYGKPAPAGGATIQ
jgi:hypothetical protein